MSDDQTLADRPPDANASRPARIWAVPIGLVLLGVAALVVWALVGGNAGTTEPAADPRPPEAASPAAVGPPVTPSGPDAQGRAARLVPRVVAEHPHDATAFTQGLLLHDGRLYESTGLRGRSSVREVDVATGNVARATRLDDSYFGEGLARVDDSLWQLTWQSGVALRYDLGSFGREVVVRYDGEGWGLCHDGERLVMSDGSDRLTFRDPETFEPTGELPVTLDGVPVQRLNELECVGDLVYANVWQTNDIVEIDPGTGVVTAVIDGTQLTQRALELATADMDVLNGIAWDPEAGHFLVTGKLWPVLFEVVFEPEG